ncbi:DUF1648 domain-containing protein [Peribacillus alkalitolerans]|uniref:DUF1648 domain-containing protein n=1 Tax=Peribacillus alkalitolerans TaxID=1550385 RepID=UPI0013D885CB|nr:DUF1648 domain-containing protein [Peribacillus alkalitolerans]
MEKPVLKIPKTKIEMLFDGLGIIAFLGSAVYVAQHWMGFPDIIPTHFGANGKPDDWGSKHTIWILTAIGMLIWVGLSILERFPHTYNYMNLTPENIENQYKIGRLLVNSLKNGMIFLFSYIQWKIIQVIEGSAVGLGSWFLPILLLITFGTVFGFIVYSIKKK